MLWFEILTAVLTVIFIVYKYVLKEEKGEKKLLSKQIPGLEPSDPIEGNRKDIEKAGTITDFLSDMHKKYGSIFRFYDGKKMSVAISTPEMLKQVRHLCEVPFEVFDQFKLLMGPEAMPFQGIDEIRRRRKVYDHHFMMSACKSYSKSLVDISKTFSQKWIKSEEQIPLMKSLSRYSFASLTRCCFGEIFKDEKTLEEFQELVDWVFRHFDPKPKEGTEVYNTIVEKSGKIRGMIQKMINERKQSKRSEDDSELFIDMLLDMDLSEEAQIADVTIFISAGYFVIASVLTWVLYEAARNPDIQEKMYQEIVSKLGDQTVTVETMSQLTYVRQFVDECLRVYLSPGFTLRTADTDLEIGGYHVPVGTAVYMLFGPIFNDPKIWKNPETFDPDRFSRENSRGRNPYAFKPFGFAGKRICTGMTFALSEMIIFTSVCLRHCRLHLVPGQNVKKAPGFIIAPSEEIMVTVEKRQ